MYKNAKVYIHHDKGINGTITNHDDEKILISCCKGHTCEPGEEVKFIIHHPLKGEVSCIGKVSNSYPELIIIKGCKIEKVFQNRNETRVNLNIVVTVKRIFAGKEMKELQKFIPLHTKNLSAGGVGFFSKIEIPVNTRMIVDLPLENRIFYLETIILRKDEIPDGYYYGCSFNGLPEQLQKKIRAFVYRKQIDQKKQGLICEI